MRQMERYLVDKSEHPFAVDVKHSVIETDGIKKNLDAQLGNV